MLDEEPCARCCAGFCCNICPNFHCKRCVRLRYAQRTSRAEGRVPGSPHSAAKRRMADPSTGQASRQRRALVGVLLVRRHVWAKGFKDTLKYRQNSAAPPTDGIQEQLSLDYHAGGMTKLPVCFRIITACCAHFRYRRERRYRRILESETRRKME